MSTHAPAAPQKINLRRPDIMEAVQAKVLSHYRSEMVEQIRANGGELAAGELTVKLAKEFGFCYGVERAIDLAYAAKKYFSDVSPNTPIYLLGEIIHNPDVNDQLRNMGIQIIEAKPSDERIAQLQPGDAVIIPAFGTEVSTRKKLEAKGCVLVDTTFGDVMTVWKRVRQYSKDNVTSIIHGKAKHEETKATTSQARAYGNGHYLVVYNLEETDYVCDYIQHSGNKQDFLEKFKGAYSQGFDPELHLNAVGVANQTTMLRGETEEIQRRFKGNIFGSSTRSAARRRTGRMRSRRCCANRWISCSWSAVTTPRTPRIWRRWAKRFCPRISSRTPPRWFRPGLSRTMINTSGRRWKREIGCPPARSPWA
jgi:4-hydroxy-3-methylbut-2-enyl diphosphate reductase